MKTVSTILKRKGSNVFSIPPHITVYDALVIMADKNIGSLAVTQEGEYLGVFTERDYARKISLQGKSSKDTTVEETMSRDLPLVTPEDSVDKCMQLMTQHNVRYLPVMNNGKLSGLLSIMDVIQETMITQQETIEQLENYIRGDIS